MSRMFGEVEAAPPMRSLIGRNPGRQTAADAAATTALSIMHRKRLMIDRICRGELATCRT
jgi:hypothetical protein